MVVGFPPAEAPSDDKDVATGIVRTMVPALVGMVVRLWSVAEVFKAEFCAKGPAAATLAGRAAGFVLMSCRLKLNPCRRLLAEAAPGSTLAGWAGEQGAPLATSLFCRAWKALGAVLLGSAAGGAGLTEEGLSVAGLGAEGASNPATSFVPAIVCPKVTATGFPAAISGGPSKGVPFLGPAASP